LSVGRPQRVQIREATWLQYADPRRDVGSIALISTGCGLRARRPSRRRVGRARDARRGAGLDMSGDPKEQKVHIHQDNGTKAVH